MTCDDAAARVHLIGGEMLEWSDAAGAGADGAGVLGELLHPLLPGGARVLVAGPHPAGLFEDPAVAACEPSVLVRSYSDACRLAGHHELTVHCGSLEKAAFPGAFDVVVALDGVGRLTSFDHAGGTWAESLERLTGCSPPAGRSCWARRTRWASTGSPETLTRSIGARTTTGRPPSWTAPAR